MKYLIMPIGLPRAGKSFWALRFSQRYGVPIVNPDSIRLELHGQAFLAEAEPQVWGHASLMVRSLFRAGHTHVILDATNIKLADRDKWLSSEWTRCYKLFTTPQAVCIQRAREVDRADLVPVILRMAGEYEEPTLDELNSAIMLTNDQAFTINREPCLVCGRPTAPKRSNKGLCALCLLTHQGI